MNVPNPRGFWDYSLFALMMTGGLLLLFRVKTSNGIGWADVAIAFGSAVVLVVAIILARRNEKATWIKQPTWRVRLAATAGALTLMFGAVYADAYLLHRENISASGFWKDLMICIPVIASVFWTFRKRPTALRRTQ